MNMSFISHGIIMLLIFINVVALGKNARKEKSLEAGMNFLGITCMMFSVFIDLLRSYIIKIGD